MTRDDIIRMAREAANGMLSYDGEGCWRLSEQEVERFAALFAINTTEKLVAAGWRQCAIGQRTTQFCGATEAAVKEEREACAFICHELKLQNKFQNADDQYDDWNHGIAHGAELCRNAIRARGEK